MQQMQAKTLAVYDELLETALAKQFANICVKLRSRGHSRMVLQTNSASDYTRYKINVPTWIAGIRFIASASH